MGVVSHIVKKDQLREECLKLANKVAEKSLYTLIVAKESIKAAEELGLT
jgi:enoyl-CoA hydratase/carnithine racemase